MLENQNNGDNEAVRGANNGILLARFCAGLKPELQRQVLSKNPRDFENAVELAKAEEGNRKIWENSSRSREAGTKNTADGEVIQNLTAQIAQLSVEVRNLKATAGGLVG